MCPSSQTMVSACCSISGLPAAQDGLSEAKVALCFSCFGIRHSFSPETNGASVDHSTSVNIATICWIYLTHTFSTKGIASQQTYCNAQCRLIPLWGAAAMLLPDRNIYNFVHQYHKRQTCFIYITFLALLQQTIRGITF